MYEFTVSVASALICWFVAYHLIVPAHLRYQYVYASFLAMPFGLTEAFFVPRYWQPNALLDFSLFGYVFDIESLIFSFTAGGAGAIFYELIFKADHKKTVHSRHLNNGHGLILSAILLSTIFIAGGFFHIDAIYVSLIAMGASTLFMVTLRQDLLDDAIIGGFLMLAFYFIFFFVLNAFIFPGWVTHAWNLENLWGIVVLGLPLEELVWAFQFGMMWGPIYEYLEGYDAVSIISHRFHKH